VTQAIQSAVEADAIVTADYITAIGALPFDRFSFQELLDAMLGDEFQVLDHTHPVVTAVALVDTVQTGAWELAAFRAVFDLVIKQ